MNKAIKVLCLDTGLEMVFSARTGLEAMQKALYTLDLRRLDKNAKIELAGGGRTLTMTHNGETYSTLSDWSFTW